MSAWTYLFFGGSITLAELRRLNKDTLLPWTLGLLFALMDCGLDIERDADATLHAAIDNGEIVSDIIRVRHGGRVVAVIRECDDGDFIGAAEAAGGDT